MGHAQSSDSNNAEVCTKREHFLSKLPEGVQRPSYVDCETDSSGCRIFSPLPKCGTHPRLVFTKEDIPFILERYASGAIGKELQYNLDSGERIHKERYKVLCTIDENERIDPSKETIEKHLREEPMIRDAWFLAFLKGYMTSNEELISEVKEHVLFHARLIISCHQIQKEESLTSKPFRVFATNAFTLEHAFTFGGFSFAILYDLLFTRFSEDEVQIVRKALSLATTGRRSWGMTDTSCRRIQSNWSGYHGDLLAMCAAIEGEDGYDAQVYDLFADLMFHFFSFGFYESGHSVEDAYACNLGLREGSMALMVMARRGFNLFRHPTYKNIWTRWVPFALHPNRSGRIYGGSSGNDMSYCTSVCIAKYMYPRCEIVDFVYRRFMSAESRPYCRLEKWQTRSHTAAFALPALCSDVYEELPEGAVQSMPLTFHCNDRGKVVMRSDWTESALWFTLDARPDAFIVGHDAPSRGSFVLNACGRSWGNTPEWRIFDESTDYSLLSIDGQGQRRKAPSVKLTHCVEGEGQSTFAAADLTYAYKYEWTNWAKPCEEKRLLKEGWEVEPHSPRDFGMTAYWLPDKLHGEPGVGFAGLHQWRRRFNNVDKVVRRSLMIRDAPVAFLIMEDVVCKADGEEHDYTWHMSVDEDVELLSYDNGDVTLGSTSNDGGTCSGPRLVLRCLTQNEDPEPECLLESYSKDIRGRKKTDGTFEQLSAKRLLLKVRGKTALFRLGFFALNGPTCSPPETRWTDTNILTVVSPSSKDNQKAGATQIIEFSSVSHYSSPSDKRAIRVLRSSRDIIVSP